MIKYLERDKIKVDLYDKCVSNAINNRIYAQSWYLDNVCENWGALVLNDYEAVMPLPHKKKYFINYIYLPNWTQQLGIFSNGTHKTINAQDFISSIPKRFKKITIQFNSDNFVENCTKERTNCILNLNKEYKELFANFKKDRKKRVTQAINYNLKIERNESFKQIIDVFKIDYKEKLNINKLHFNKLEKVINAGLKKNAIEIWNVYDENDQYLSGLITLKNASRVTVLFSSTTKIGLKKNAFSLIINDIIKKYANTNLTLDFEGSEIESIKSFNLSFGASTENYPLLIKKISLF